MNVPKNWNEVSIATYYNLLEALEIKWETKEDQGLALLSALTGISMKDLYEKYSITQVSKAIKSIGFINERAKNKPKVTVKIKGRKFEFDMILRDSNANSFISLSELSKEPNSNVHNIVAIFTHELNFFGFRKPRTIQSQKEMAEFFKENMTMDMAFSYLDFFLRSYKTLSEATRIYLSREKAKAMKIMRKVIDQPL